MEVNKKTERNGYEASLDDQAIDTVAFALWAFIPSEKDRLVPTRQYNETVIYWGVSCFHLMYSYSQTFTTHCNPYLRLRWLFYTFRANNGSHPKTYYYWRFAENKKCKYELLTRVGVKAKVLDCSFKVNRFEYQSSYYIQFWSNTLEKVMNPIILSALG